MLESLRLLLHSFVLFGTNIHCREQIIHNSKGPAFLVSCTKDECVGVESTPKFVCNYSQSSLQFSQSGFASAILLFNFLALLQQHQEFPLLSAAKKPAKFNVETVKVPILKEVNFGKMQLCRVEHFYNIFVLTFGRDC